MIKFPWSINNSLIANFFIGIGYIVRNYNDQFLNTLENKKLGAIVVLMFLIFVLFNYNYLQFPYNFPANVFGNIIVFIIHALFGIYFALFLASLLKNQYLLMFVGANSLLFYFYQNQVLKVLKKIADILGANSPDYFIPIIMMLVAVVLLIVPILLTNKFFPLMAGKYKFLSNRL